MSYLLDTNVLSELRRKAPDRHVVEWIAARPPSTLYLSVLTLGEIRKGIDTLTDRKRRAALLDWLEADLPAFFSGRVLTIDERIADRWGRLLAAARRPLPAIDSLLAATASSHDLAMVTRNARDFAGLGISVIDPWSGEGSVPGPRHRVQEPAHRTSPARRRSRA
ncbi:MAG: type II toxin-antitoxin system VapC family toxin [Burkholderiaceae bacterium]|nr:type II toxin-antitoxin system VapC family toxin [Burkholderiaceae bacterium]